MKTFLLAVILACSACLAQAQIEATAEPAAAAAPSALDPQPSTPPAPTVQHALQELVDAIGASNTNWDFAVYGIYAPKLDQKYGGGIGAFHEVNPYLVAGLRVEFLDGGFVMPDGTATLQLPLHPIKNWPWLVVTPFTYAGIGLPLGGVHVAGLKIPGKDISVDGEPLAIIGAGGALKIIGGASWTLNLAGDIEKWPSLVGKANASVPGNMYRVGLILNKTF